MDKFCFYFVRQWILRKPMTSQCLTRWIPRCLFSSQRLFGLSYWPRRWWNRPGSICVWNARRRGIPRPTSPGRKMTCQFADLSRKQFNRDAGPLFSMISHQMMTAIIHVSFATNTDASRIPSMSPSLVSTRLLYSIQSTNCLIHGAQNRFWDTATCEDWKLWMDRI